MNHVVKAQREEERNRHLELERDAQTLVREQEDLVAKGFVPETLSMQAYCQALEDSTTGSTSRMARMSAMNLARGVPGSELDGSALEDEEFVNALAGYRLAEQRIRGMVYLGWRRFVMMCEAGAVMREWEHFPLHLLQAAYSVLPHLSHLAEARENVLKEQQVLWDCQRRLTAAQEAKPAIREGVVAVGDSTAGRDTPGAMHSQQQPPQQQQQQHEMEGKVRFQKGVVTECEARVRQLQKMLDLLPFVTKSNIDFILFAAPSIRAIFKPSGANMESENDYIWCRPTYTHINPHTPAYTRIHPPI